MRTKFQKRIKEIISDPAFNEPIANLNKDYSKQGTLKLVTKIKPTT